MNRKLAIGIIFSAAMLLLACGANSDTNTPVIKTKSVGAHEHNFTEAITKEPTCLNPGEKQLICECGETKTETIEAVGHVFENYVFNEDASYDADGTESATCKYCNETDTRVAEGTMLVLGNGSPISYDDFNISGYGYSNFIDLYATFTGRDDVKSVVLMSTECEEYANYPDELSSDTQTIRGIKLGDTREDVIAAYGEPDKEVVYRNQHFKFEGSDPQYNMNYRYIDERYPEVFFCLSFNMDQNDKVMAVFYDSILMKWYD